jgi:diphthamide biosynthesis protein 7
LDWSNRRLDSHDLGSLVASLSNGSLCLLKPVQTGLTETDSWHAHDFEPWIAAWNYWDQNIIYSGGDDLKMKGWDVRQGFSHPFFVNKRFEGGVTTIQSNPHIDHIIAVGSYDSTVRLFDMRNPLVPLTQASVGGGAWRVKWHPLESRKTDLLVACMHDGCKVIKFSGDIMGGNQNGGSEWSVTKRFDAHESMAYGADWSFGTAVGEETLVASCSFYDHALYLWSA